MKLVEELKPLVQNNDVDVVYCVPAIDIVPVVEAVKGTNVKVSFCTCSAVTPVKSDLIWKRIQSIVTPISLWKMNMTPSQAVKLVEELKPLVQNNDVDVV